MFVTQNQRNLQRALLSILTISLLYIFVACAKIGSPLGGPVDEDPPVVIKTQPPDSTVNFTPQKNIEITFDEFIQLQDIYQELMISPPLEEKPVAQLKGKSLIVRFPDDTKFDTTTYTISFGSSIVDNNESNVLRYYEFIFSLKNYIDSMNVEGGIINSFDHIPDEERMYVMLYKNLNDSAPLLEKPSYISRADMDGKFSFHNLETGSYRLFALKDVNSNLIFDLPEEQIAFYDSTIELTSERFQDNIIIQDTILSDIIHQEDSILLDSSLHDSLGRQARLYSFHTQLLYFTQEIKNQYLVDYLRNEKEQLLFAFNKPLADTFHITPINFQPSGSWYLLDTKKNRDTLIFWLTDTTVIGLDSLQFEVKYPVYDSIGALLPYTDTLLFTAPVEKDRSKRPRRNKNKEDADQEENEVEPAKILNLTNNVKKAGSFDLNKKIGIISKTPCFDFHVEKFHLYRFEDTLEIPHKFTLQRDTNSYYQYFIQYEPEELTTYKLVILDSALTNIYGSANDTTIIKFKTQAADYYGILTLNLSNINNPVILQLLDDKEQVLSQQFLKNDQKIRYEYLPPKKYLLKIIVDSNGNGKWDTGHYLQKLQPEKVLYFPQEIDVRSNWEIDFNWPLNY